MVVLKAINALRVKYVLNMHDEVAQYLSLRPVDIYHNIKFFDNVLDFPLKDSLWVDIKEWNVKL